ncbi:MAG: hypothetical protein FGM40_05075 [Rhodocyclaceae bacterium]|nr:hypothetical protein [Rhodocyclaceae bacterium]
MTPALAELVSVLMSWAVQLSGYPAPAHLPEVELVKHQWLIEQACGGQACKIQGWLPPGDRIYLDEGLDPVASTMDSSVLLHELVHYLQRESGRFGDDCSAAIDKEREAYATQRSFLAAYGQHAPMFIVMHGLACGSTGGTPPTPGAPGNSAAPS